MNLDQLRALGDDDDVKVVVCVAWGEHAVPSVQSPCVVCRRLLAISKGVRKELPDAHTVCGRCAAAADPDVEPKITPGARREVAARTGRDPGLEPGISLRDFIRRTGI